jgi:hypothetical protein
VARIVSNDSRRDVDPADADRPGVDVVEARKEPRDGRLAGAAGSDECDQLPGLDPERHVVQDLVAAAGVELGDLLQRRQRDLVRCRVAEADGVELHRQRTRGQRQRGGRLGDQRWQIEHLEHTLEADQCAHHLDPGAGQCGERGVEAGEQQRQRDDVAGGQAAVQREVGDPSRHGNGGKHLGPEPALAVGAGASRDRFGQWTLDRSDGVEELRLQGGCGGDQRERVAVGFSVSE